MFNKLVKNQFSRGPLRFCYAKTIIKTLKVQRGPYTCLYLMKNMCCQKKINLERKSHFIIIIIIVIVVVIEMILIMWLCLSGLELAV